MITVANPGRVNGRMTRKKIWNSPAVSMRAAWTSSLGRVSKNARIRNIANGAELDTYNTTRPRREFRRPKLLNC